MMQPPITDLTKARLQSWLADRQEPVFRFSQLSDWLYKKWADDFAEMLNLPETLRAELGAAFRASAVEVLEVLEDEEKTVKWLLGLADDETTETVLVEAPGRYTVCVSTQVGCPVRCVFCASGAQGLVRNLTAGEIVDQVRTACRHLGRRVNNLVVMGMGEPLLNLKHLIPALDAICDPQRIGLGARHVTISTSGIVPGIRELAALHRQWHLALSLHAVTDRQREALIPPVHRYPLAEILEACREYRAETGRIITLEYALVHDTNDSPDDAARLAEIGRSMDAKINLIPCNPTGRSHRSPDEAHVAGFLDRLTRNGAKATLRVRKGDAIQAACGQLRRRAREQGEAGWT